MYNKQLKRKSYSVVWEWAELLAPVEMKKIDGRARSSNAWVLFEHIEEESVRVY